MVDQATIDAALQPFEDVRADAGMCRWTDVATAIGQARRVLADSPSSHVVGYLTADEAWDELCNADDRTSPADYPNHALITREELADFMHRHGRPRIRQVVVKPLDISEASDV